MLASEKLRELYKEKKKNGLVDVKFDFKETAKDASFEQLCQEILYMETAISQGKFTELNFGDGS